MSGMVKVVIFAVVLAAMVWFLKPFVTSYTEAWLAPVNRQQPAPATAASPAAPAPAANPRESLIDSAERLANTASQRIRESEAEAEAAKMGLR